jgi:hypothetical protein
MGETELRFPWIQYLPLDVCWHYTNSLGNNYEAACLAVKIMSGFATSIAWSTDLNTAGHSIRDDNLQPNSL